MYVYWEEYDFRGGLMLFRKTQNEKKNMVEVSNLNALLEKRLKGEAIDIGDNGELEAFFRKVESTLYDLKLNQHESLKDINHLGQYIMKMDFVKDMIMRLNTQLSAIEMVASTSEEMSASIMEIAEHVFENTESANKSVEVTEKGTKELTEAVELIGAAYDLTGEAKDRVGDVTQQATKINEMVNVIESVAEQTNLLALNASIEAARAGEAGKGFAVVADEIKKLSESTKDSVKLIQDLVNELNVSVDSSVQAIENATVSFDKGVTYINKASESVDSSREETVSILKSMESISLQIEQQTAAAQEVAANVADINEHTRRLHATTTQTGRAFMDIASEVNNVRKDLIEHDTLISDTDVIDIAITDHLNWRWSIYNMILGYEKLSSDKVGDHHQCRLGKWMKDIGSINPNYKTSLEKISVPHEQLHKNAKLAVAAYNKGDVDLAEDHLKAIEADSEIVLGVLSEMMASTLDSRETAKSAALFQWSKRLTVYNAEIDGQHKKLLEIGTKLQNFRESKGKSKADFLKIITELKDYTVYHFESEEQIMADGGYKDLERHKEIHKNFVKQVTSIDFNKFDYENKEELKKLIVFLSKWVLQHIRNEDFKYSTYLHDK